MNSVINNSSKDISQSEFIIEDSDNIDVENDISYSISDIIDVNDIGRSMNAEIFQDLVKIKTFNLDLMINVITRNSIINDFYDFMYFTSIFSILFPYETRKHLDA